MARFPSVAQAENAALEGRNESQDSQAILDALKAEFGLGTIHGVQTRPGVAVTQEAQSRAAPQRATTREAANDVCVDAAVDDPGAEGTRVLEDLPDTAVAGTAVHHGRLGDVSVHIDEFRARVPFNLEKKASAASGRAHGIANMDVSQQTPTQVNADRDYAQFCELLPSSPTRGQTQTQVTTNDEPRMLNPDDTGAVNFGSLSEFARPSSQVSEDGGFENTRGEWRRPDDTSQLQANQALTPYKQPGLPPETPALPKNPFGSKSNVGVPFGGTQLFGQTQMLSSAVKIASPTSSRPSPNVFLNSISLNIMETSPLKNRTNISSPTDIRTSSPTRLHEVPATLLKDKTLAIAAEETPVPLRPQKDDLIPESPTFATPRTSIGHQPMAHYEPMKQSQERKSSGDGLRSYHMSDSHSDDTFQQLDRKRRAEKLRAQAAVEMDKVSFIRTQRRPADEQPPEKKRRKLGTEDTDAQVLKTNGQGQSLMIDSQKAITQSAEQSVESTKAAPGQTVEPADASAGLVDTQSVPEPSDEEMIPATSPIRASPAASRRDAAASASEPELPVLRRSGTEQGPEDLDSSSLPPMRRKTQQTYNGRGRGPRTRLAVMSSAEESEQVPGGSFKQQVVETEGPEDTTKASNAPPSSYSEPPVPMGTRSRRGEQGNRTPRTSLTVDRHMLTSSSLTNLSGTPEPSSKTTPGTQDSQISYHAESVNLVPPENGGRSLRRRPRNAVTSESPQPITKATKLSRRCLRMDSDSTDELHRSPSATALDRSTHSKSVRMFRTSLASTTRARRLFDGMAFALSFSDNQAQRTRLESKISQAGGTVLQEGFQELFEQWAMSHAGSNEDDSRPSPLRLTKAGLENGFAALIADSHSRKAKYMQALALGLPCLAPQWVTSCLKRGEVIDWAPYLLCAGASQVLGNAIRSRILAPYAALGANLSDIIDTRDKLLHGQRLLVVMDHKKSRKETKQQYLFLALALGPSVTSRATTAQQAGEAVRHAELAGAPYGWIYADSSTASVADVLAAAQKKGRKRRRAAGKPLGQDLRVLSDELVIQSLILGRMVDPDDVQL